MNVGRSHPVLICVVAITKHCRVSSLHKTKYFSQIQRLKNKMKKLAKPCPKMLFLSPCVLTRPFLDVFLSLPLFFNASYPIIIESQLSPKSPTSRHQYIEGYHFKYEFVLGGGAHSVQRRAQNQFTSIITKEIMLSRCLSFKSVLSMSLKRTSL